MDLKCHIYEYVHDIIYACYKFFCTPREFAAHMIFVGKARFQWNHRARWIVILNCSLKTNALKGHYETNSHFICGICVFYVYAHNLCIFKYIFKQIYLPPFSNEFQYPWGNAFTFASTSKFFNTDIQCTNTDDIL